jgi:hypothetical protein
MQRSATISLTAPGDTNVNRLRTPDFGVVKLQLAVGGKSSKSHFPSGGPAPASGGSDDFHFAPENEKVTITWEIDDVLGVIDTAELELFCRFQEAPVWKLDLTKLGVDWYCHGAHEVEWDGRLPLAPQAEIQGEVAGGGMKHKLTSLDPHPDEKLHPDGYVTVEHTSYKLRIVVGSGKLPGKPTAAWTYFQVLVKELKLELGAKKMLPKPATGAKDLDALVYDDDDAEALNGSLPAEGARKKVFLTSNLFSLSCAEQFVNTDHTLYKALWGDGPRVPVVAAIKIRTSADAGVDAPKALGHVRLLWDVEEIDESGGSVHGSHHATAKTFIEKAVAYKKTATHPKGDNCHKDRGGKRGDEGKSYFPDAAGYAAADSLKDREFPFKVEKCTTRKWAAFSYPWTKGAAAGKSGVLFQPSRMAGDAYKVTAYLAFDKTADNKIVLDTDVDPPLKVHADIKKSTGTFEIWRRVNFVKYMKKKSTVTPNFPVATFQGYYKQAYLQMKDTTGGSTDMVKADAGAVKGYDSRVAAAVATRDWYMKLMIASGSQYDAGAHAIDFVDYDAWKSAVKVDKGWDDVDLAGFLGTVLDTDAKYNAYCGNIATSILTDVGKTYMHDDDGINLFHFNEHYNLATEPGGQSLNGFAPGTAIARNRCMFVLCAGPNNYSGSHNKAEQTVAHEIGHCLLLAHSTDGVSATDDCNKPDAPAHDTAWSNCTMSYNYTAERKFCGLCLLRLRGWDRDQLSKTADTNTSP